jgi:hypothetical protein
MKLLTAAILAGLLLIALYGSVRAAPRQETLCWFADGWLYATGLPTTYPYSVTSEPIPTGTTSWSVDGTLALYVPWVEQAFFWVRGHGPSLIKAGPGLQDYRVICIAEAA